jgi:hypothetical protein
MQKFHKVIKCGNVVEIYCYDERMLNKKVAKQGGRKEVGQSGSKERKEEYRSQVNYRAREAIRRLVNTNFGEGDIFLTLTFKDNIGDLERANKEFKKFVQRVKRRQESFKYIAVIEFQKRGAVHYHLVCNLRVDWGDRLEREAKEREIAKLWGQGFVDIEKVRSLVGVDNVGAYLVKYLKKGFEDSRLEGKKRYLYSKCLEKPKEMILADEKQKWIDTLESFYPWYTSSYGNVFTGQVQYREYNLKRLGLEG